MDAFEHFFEQQQSVDSLDKYREPLAREATETLREHPGANVVGVVIEAGTPEEAWVRQTLGAQAPPPGKEFAGIMSRQLVLELLRTNHAQLLDWLVDPGAPGERRILPLVAFTRNGSRASSVEFDL